VRIDPGILVYQAAEKPFHWFAGPIVPVTL
jgi:hypothetical protein